MIKESRWILWVGAALLLTLAVPQAGSGEQWLEGAGADTASSRSLLSVSVDSATPGTTELVLGLDGQ